MAGLAPSSASTDPGALRTIGHAHSTATIVSPYLQIGPLVFFPTEHPTELKIGGVQKIATHDYLGGTRSAQTLGDTLKDVSWSGQLYAVQGGTVDMVRKRVRLGQQLRAAGAELRLKYLDERYDVIITEFDGTYYHRHSGKYDIIVRPIRDVSGRYTKANAASVDALTTQLSQQAQAQVAAIVAADPKAALTQNAVAQAVSDTANAQPIAKSAGATQNNTAASSINAALSKAQTYLSTAAPLFGNGQVLAASNLVSTLRIISGNLAAGQAPTTISVVGGTLSSIAARYYGDPTLARALAAANGLAALTLPPGRATVLKLPPLQAA